MDSYLILPKRSPKGAYAEVGGLMRRVGKSFTSQEQFETQETFWFAASSTEESLMFIAAFGQHLYGSQVVLIQDGWIRFTNSILLVVSTN